MKGIKITAIVLLCLFALFFMVLGLRVLLFPVNTFVKSVDTAYGVVDKTLDADNAIYNYEWFKRQEESIKALYKKETRAIKEHDDFIRMLPDDAQTWSREDKNESSRLSSIAWALGNQIDDAIAEYNARSSMVNRAIFKDSLPSNISRAWIAGKELTKQEGN